MNFYDALQLDPSVLKRNISRCGTRREKLFYWITMAVRSVLIVTFAVLFISVLSGLFGQENTPLAVVLFCILLGIRFVNFEYCIGDSMVNLAAVFGILLFIPVAASAVPPVAAAVLHFAGFFALLYITSQRPEYGNGGLYSFAYVYLSGNPVYGYALEERAALAFAGYILCAAVLCRKHRNAHPDIRFRQVIRRFDLHNPVYLWQLRMAVGVSLILAAGQFFDVERFMWMGFACASLLSEYPYCGGVSSRFRQRIIGVLAGSGAFFILFQITPENFHIFMGPLGGLCLGFCTDYRFKTAFNCLGALMLAVGIYGIQGATVLRIADTVMGVIFGTVFALLFHRFIAVRLMSDC